MATKRFGAAPRTHSLAFEYERMARLEAKVIRLERRRGIHRDTRPCRCLPLPHKTRQCHPDCQCWCHRSPDYRPA